MGDIQLVLFGHVQKLQYYNTTTKVKQDGISAGDIIILIFNYSMLFLVDILKILAGQNLFIREFQGSNRPAPSPNFKWMRVGQEVIWNSSVGSQSTKLACL